ncbi:MAG: 50S ribosomal protein L24 [Candidatus Pacebacteria bacterium]|nr:50S ribosomal protein L24 [Candidatus Paceibacterota bacterium]
MKIKKGDNVLVISGKDKGKKGKVLQVFPIKERIVVENVNLRKKNVKAKRANEKGQIVQFPAPLAVSNVKIICPKCSVSARVGYIVKDGKKSRICKKCNKEI